MSFLLKHNLLQLKKKTKGKVGNKGRLLVQFSSVMVFGQYQNHQSYDWGLQLIL